MAALLLGGSGVAASSRSVAVSRLVVFQSSAGLRFALPFGRVLRSSARGMLRSNTRAQGLRHPSARGMLHPSALGMRRGAARLGQFQHSLSAGGAEGRLAA